MVTFLNTSIVSLSPSLFILSGMWWTVCSLTQELVNICSSTEDKEEVLKPWGRKEIETVNDSTYHKLLKWVSPSIPEAEMLVSVSLLQDF